MIGEIVTQSDLQAMARMSALNASQTGYIAPTIFRPAGGVSNYNYYKTLADALSKYKYLNKIAGGKNIAPAGFTSFKSAKAETFGINADFFGYMPAIGLVPVPYVALKQLFYTPKKAAQFICRFYKTDSTGPFYAVVANTAMAVEATVIKNESPVKIAALDEYNRQLQLAKSKYNSFAAYLNTIAKQSPTLANQKFLLEGGTMLANFKQELANIKGADIVFSKNKGVGAFIIDDLIIIIVVAAVVAAWSLQRISDNNAAIKKVNASYDFQKFAAQHSLEIDKALNAGQITKEQADKEKADLQIATDAAQKNAAAASVPTGDLFDKIQNILLIGIGGMLLWKFVGSASSTPTKSR
ncbi:MAG: hypothetical protein H7320_13125 [Ferruginibacter sp.]|nr:hypothetical protein [Ferruginibacter sp.]